MPRRLIVITLLLGLVGLGGGCARRQAVRPESEEVLALELLDHLCRGEYSEATRMFDPVLRARLPAPQLESVWQGLAAQLGSLTSLDQTQTARSDGHTVIIVPMQFEAAVVNARVVFDERKQIAGLWFAPAQTGEAYSAPPYADFERFLEREVTVGGGDWALPGTLSVPKGRGPFPAIVLVHGSGPHDRDQTILANKPFRDLAHGLASRGVVVLRYDKRTLVHGAKMTTITPQDEVTADALAALELVREQPEVDGTRVFVLGHSLGGYLAPAIAAQAGETLLGGLIVMAAPARPLEDVTLDQVRYIVGLSGPDASDAELQQLRLFEKQVARVKDAAGWEAAGGLPTPEQLPLGCPAEWWLALLDYDPLAVAAGLAQPLLVLHGERDYQVTLEDLAGWSTLDRPGVAIKSFPHLNHLMMAGDGPATPGEYSRPANVDAEIISTIAGWLEEMR